MKEPSTDFGKYLRNVRKQRKLTIRQLEDKSGVSNAYISHVESGKRNVPMPEVIRKLSTALDIPYEDMMREAGHLDQDSKGGESMNRIDSLKSELEQWMDEGADWIARGRNLMIDLQKGSNRLTNCSICGTKFMPKRDGAIYCTNACRQMAKRMRKAREEEA